MEASDPYSVLGVSQDASAAQVKKAHRTLVLQHHPDRVANEHSKERALAVFQRVQAAYDILKDWDSRVRYDIQVALSALRRAGNTRTRSDSDLTGAVRTRRYSSGNVSRASSCESTKSQSRRRDPRRTKKTGRRRARKSSARRDLATQSANIGSESEEYIEGSRGRSTSDEDYEHDEQVLYMPLKDGILRPMRSGKRNASSVFICSSCDLRFESKIQRERHENTAHTARCTWSCSRLENPVASFQDRGDEFITCGYCGNRFLASERHYSATAHVEEFHKFGACNEAKVFFRLYHFRQHLRHSHAATIDSWTKSLTDSCLDETRRFDQGSKSSITPAWPLKRTILLAERSSEGYTIGGTEGGEGEDPLSSVHAHAVSTAVASALLQIPRRQGGWTFRHVKESIAKASLVVRKWLRPRPIAGTERLEWICACGSRRYGDYRVSCTEDLMRFHTALIDKQSSRWHSSQHVSASPGTTTGTISISGTTAQNSSNAPSSAISQLPTVGSDPSATVTSYQGATATAQQSFTSSVGVDGPAFFEVCVNQGRHLVSLGEINLRDSRGIALIQSDIELFSMWDLMGTGKIRRRYLELCRKGLHQVLYRPVDVHFVRFAVQRAGRQIGIYEGPLAIPPEKEVAAKRYHYHECPLEPLPPIDRRTFFHYFYASEEHPHCHGNAALDLLFYNRLPKKLNGSMLNNKDPSMIYGWGIHIIEGPNKPLLAWLATAILIASFLVALIYDIVRGNADSGFGIGQWMVATLSMGVSAAYFHLEDMA